jgi:hypothetical protein
LGDRVRVIEAVDASSPLGFAPYRFCSVRVEPDGAMRVSTREPLEPARVPRARDNRVVVFASAFPRAKKN